MNTLTSSQSQYSRSKGFVCVPRPMFDHPLCQKKREFSPMEALIDFCRLARSLPTEKLKRGEFQCSYQGLAERWGWSRGRVKRFMDAREKDHVLVRRFDASRALVFAVTGLAEPAKTPTKPASERVTGQAPEPPKPCPVAVAPSVDRPQVEHKTDGTEQKKERTKERKASEFRYEEAGESEKCSNLEQAAPERVAAVSPPTRMDRENPRFTQPQYPRWYFTRPPGGLAKHQARHMLNGITLEIYPPPPKTSWLFSELARWRGRL
jgi:hypothetical protein